MPVTVTATPLSTVKEGINLVQSRELGGRVRSASFEYTAPEAHADGSKVELVKLPANRVRVLGALSYMRTSAFGASRVGKVGYQAFTKRADNTTEEADDDAFAVSLDLENAAINNLHGNIAAAGTYIQVESRDGVTLELTVTGGTIPSGATIKGEIFYIVD